MAKKGRPYRPPPLQEPETLSVEDLGNGAIKTTKLIERGVMRLRRESVTNPDPSHFEAMTDPANARKSLESKRLWLRDFLKRRKLKTDEDFVIDYVADLPNCLWKDMLCHERDKTTEIFTQSHAVYTLLRSLNFILANFTDTQIQAILLFANAHRDLHLVSRNRELTAGKKTLTGAKLAGELRAHARAIRQRRWQEVARAMAVELGQRHPDWTRASIAREIAKRLEKDHGLTLKPDTIARAIRP